MLMYFAQIDVNTNIVQNVLVAKSLSWCVERIGGTWIQTYKSTPGKNFAGKGHIYHPERENFSGPQPYPSWTLDDQCHWQPPVPRPDDDKFYTWTEETRTWDEIPE